MVKNKNVSAALVLVIFVGLIANEKNIRAQRSYVSGQSFVEPELEPLENQRSYTFGQSFAEPKPEYQQSASRAIASDYEFVNSDCLSARKDSVPVSLYRKLLKPYINLGFPKTGTTSLHNYFGCGGLISTHLKCGRTQSCSQCTRKSVAAGLPPLSKCKNADVYAQIDDGKYFPQIELLEEFVQGHPNATFLLTFRSMEKWYHSITHWPPRKHGPHMDDRWKKANITGSPSNEKKSNIEEFSEWYCKHVKRVRNIVAQNPSLALVEIDIEDSEIGQRMEDVFGIDKSCWGHTNVNANIHPEVNRSEVIVSKILIHKEKDISRTTAKDDDVDDYDDDEMNDDEGKQTNRSAGNESTNDFDSEAKEDEDSDEEDGESHDSEADEDSEEEDGKSHDANEMSRSQSSDIANNEFLKLDCLSARKDSVPESSFRKLPKPYINLGFPKMGTTSIDRYFKCGGLVSTHFTCGRHSKKCGVCTRESVEAGLAPLSQCGKADVYAQLDDGAYFPQIELLEEFVYGHPNATFFLTFRSMEKWYHSITHWPPRKNGPHMDERWKKRNITGSPSNEGRSNLKEFSDWYCEHVKRVRKMVAHNPSHTLVEIDIEDPEIGERMEDMFGVDKTCWGHTNVNANIHPEVDPSEVMLSRLISPKGKRDNVKNFQKVGRKDDDKRTKRAAKNKSKKRLDAKAKEDSEDEGDESYDADDNNASQFSDKSKNAHELSCLRARKDTVPVSLFQKLPKPYISLGFPKMGTTSLWKFFACGGLASSHYYCHEDETCADCKQTCAKCVKQSVEAGLPPLSKCGNFDVYTQLDNGVYFPQIEALEELAHGYPSATFFLTFRNMEKWYHSISNWPEHRDVKLDERFKRMDITGSPSNKVESNPEEFSDWYCKHVKRVRKMVAQNPSHTLVEIDVEDPDTGQRMSDMFGIDKSCWGQFNVNGKIHPEFNRTEARLRNPMKRKNRKHQQERN